MDKKKFKKCVTEVYARVTGFMRPVQDWNKGKEEEFKDRTEYNFTPKKRKEYKDGEKEYPHIDYDGFK